MKPYSDDLRRRVIEAVIKTYLRAVKARTYDALSEALKQALLTITAKDTIGWFASCGYSLH